MDRKWTFEDAWNMYNVVGEDPHISDADRDMIGDMLANLISRLSADDVAPLAWLEAEPGATRVSLQSEHGMRIHSMQFHVGKNKPVNRPEGNKLFPLYTTPPAHAAERLAADEMAMCSLDCNHKPECIYQHLLHDSQDHHRACVLDLYKMLGIDGSDGEVRYKWVALEVAKLVRDNEQLRSVTPPAHAAKDVGDGWRDTFIELLEDYAGARVETGIWNLTQRVQPQGGMRMPLPRLARLMAHVDLLAPTPAKGELG